MSTWQAKIRGAQMGLSAFTCQTSAQVSNTDTADYTRRYCCDKNGKKKNKKQWHKDLNSDHEIFLYNTAFAFLSHYDWKLEKKKKKRT